MQYCRKCPDAVAEIRGGVEVPQLSGCVQFYQENGCVLIVARLSGLPRECETGFFGFHIHEGESCSGADFSETGAIIVQLVKHIRNTQVTCRRCWHAKATHICP